MAIGDVRAAFAEAVDVFDGPLYRSWCRAVADEVGRDDATLTAFESRGLRFENWKAVQSLLRATSMELRRAGEDLQLVDYFPVLGGHLSADDRAFQLWRELLRDRRGHLVRHLAAPTRPLNDPISGVRILSLLDDYLNEMYAEPLTLELLCVGAAAGLELVADALPADVLPADVPSPGGRGATGERPLLHRHSIVHRGGVDLEPLDPRDPVTVDAMLSLLEPEEVDRQTRIRRAAQLAQQQDIVVSKRDAFAAVAAPGFGFGRLPVVFGSSFLCSVPEPTRMDDVMRARYAEGIWISDEAAGVMRGVADDPELATAPPMARVTRLVHYRAGEAVAIRTRIDGDRSTRARR